MPLSNPRFAGQPTLEAALNGSYRILSGEPDADAVQRIQSALIDLSYDLPTNGADGNFGAETSTAVVKFKTDRSIYPNDAVIGSKTMTALDNETPIFQEPATTDRIIIPEELIVAKEAIEPIILSLPGINGIGIGMLENTDGELFNEIAVRIYVEPDAIIPAELPQEVGGVQVCVVRAQFEPCVLLPDEDRYKELIGGIKITSPLIGHGTLGAIAQHTNSETNQKQLVGLTCYHVAGPANVKFPDTIWQPKDPFRMPNMTTIPHDDNLGEVIGVDYPNMLDLVSLSNAMYGFTDSAIFKLDDPISQRRKISRGVAGHDGPPMTIDKVTATATPSRFPQNVRKRGFVTGLTHGTILGAEISVQWTPDGLAPAPGAPKLTIKKQFEIVGSDTNPNGSFCEKGDSGALILDADSKTALGLLWGKCKTSDSRAIMSPIEAIESRLGIKLVW